MYSINKYHYTKIEFTAKELNKTQQTATKYLEELTQRELLRKIKKGKTNYYINIELFNILVNVSGCLKPI